MCKHEVCMCRFVIMQICPCVYVCTYLSVLMSACVCVCVCVCACVCVCVCLMHCFCVFVCLCVCLCVCVCVWRQHSPADSIVLLSSTGSHEKNRNENNKSSFQFSRHTVSV